MPTCKWCDYDFQYSAGFCCDKFRKETKEYKNIRKAARRIGKKLSKAERENLLMVIESINDLVYEYEVFGWIRGE
jgi:hypothetical protein